MKNTLRILAAAAILGSAGIANAQNTSTEHNATAEMSVVSPIRINALQSLKFGTVVQGTGTATVASNAGSTASYTGAVAPGSFGLSIHAAKFAVTGQNFWTYGIITPATTTVTDGTHTALVTLGTPGADAALGMNGAGTVASLDATGNDSWYLGGTVTLDGSQPAGNYSGIWDETVFYN